MRPRRPRLTLGECLVVVVVCALIAAMAVRVIRRGRAPRRPLARPPVRLLRAEPRSEAMIHRWARLSEPVGVDGCLGITRI